MVPAGEYTDFIRARHPGLNGTGGLQPRQDYIERGLNGDFTVDPVGPVQWFTLNLDRLGLQMFRAQYQQDDRQDAHDRAAPAPGWMFGADPVDPER